MAEKLAARKRLPPPNVAHADDPLAVSGGGPPGVARRHPRRLGRFPDDPDFIVLADTGGNRFCIVDLGYEYRSPGQAS